MPTPAGVDHVKKWMPVSLIIKALVEKEQSEEAITKILEANEF